MSDQSSLYALLDQLSISYEKHEHDAVFTCEQSEALELDLPGAHTKQLLMRDKKATMNILAIVMHDKKVDIKALAEQVGVKNLSFASEERLETLLHVKPGSVTPFGLMFDTNHEIDVIIDEDAWNIGTFQFHPLLNTATLVIQKPGLETFFKETGHHYTVQKIPQK